MAEPRFSRSWSPRIGVVVQILAGTGLLIAGAVMLTTATRGGAGEYAIALAQMFLGIVLLLRGAWRIELIPSFGYKSYVAWRYLLIAHPKVTTRTKVAIVIAMVFRGVFYMQGNVMFGPVLVWNDPMQVGALASTGLFMVVVFWGVLRHSKPAMFAFLFGIGVAVIATIGLYLARHHQIPFITLDGERLTRVLQGLVIAQLVGSGIAGLASFFGSLRAFFTFFTTVPIGGVWIGTAALVCVLAVMSGFETDLRDKILGSNAHIQITREDGDFVEWRAAKTSVDKVPGVVASTPYASSEVVIAAHNNGMNVIIKGIDPDTVGKVTDLVADIEGDAAEDREAMQRLAPIVDDTQDLAVPQKPRPSGTVIDPPPDDMPSPGDPIDFSAPDHLDLPPDPLPDPFGGDARNILHDDKVIDPPPSDLLSSDEPPTDYSRPDADPAIHVIDIPMEPTLSRRTLGLPGVLVGRELVKQTHLYVGEEVHVVSPLSDPSNPDATGTPIPFNRDYRVAGVFYTGMYEYDLKYVYVTLDSLQDFLDRGDTVDGIEVRIEDADDTEAFVVKLHAALGPGYRIADWHELNRSLFAALKLEKIAMFLVLGIVILVASFSIVGNLIMVVVEKAREIAVLKTLGASDVGVMLMFAIQGLLIGAIGTVLGVLTGLLGCWAGKRFGLPLDPDVYYIDKLPIHVDPRSVAAAAAAGILISIAATLYPALLAARVRPAAGMRH